MGYRYVEVQEFDADEFGPELTSTLDRLRAEEGAEIVTVSMSTMIGARPEEPGVPVMRRIAQVLVWQPDPEPARKKGRIVGA